MTDKDTISIRVEWRGKLKVTRIADASVDDTQRIEYAKQYLEKMLLEIKRSKNE